MIRNSPTDEHLERWRDGLAKLRERAKKEKFFDKGRAALLSGPTSYIPADATDQESLQSHRAS